MTTYRRPVFGAPDTGRRPVLADVGYQRELLQLCAVPSRAIVARGWPCPRCLANTALPGAPIACHFLSERRPTDA